MKQEALIRAATSSVAFRAMFPALCIFPLRPIFAGGMCPCALGDRCGAIGKHPAIRWSELEAADKVEGGQTAGYGIATGARSGLFVVDLDGEDAIKAFFAISDIRPTFSVQRGPERAHLYFKAPAFEVRNSASELARGVDIRGDGGFVVGPGSPHKSGDLYTVLDDIAPVDAPKWLVKWPGLRRGIVAPPTATGSDVSIALDPATPWGRARIESCARYLMGADLSIEGNGGRDTFFGVCVYVIRRARIPVDIAVDIFEAIYNPRLVQAGTTTWTRTEIVNRLESARDTATTPLGDIVPEQVWLELNRSIA